jgi:hypothetical protein
MCERTYAKPATSPARTQKLPAKPGSIVLAAKPYRLADPRTTVKIAQALSLTATTTVAAIACANPGTDVRHGPHIPYSGAGRAQHHDAGPPAAPPSPGASTSACNAQPPQDFLIRSGFVFQGNAGTEEASRREALHQTTIRYRTERYGRVKGFGQALWNRYDPVYYSDETTFFGIKVRMNKRVIPALSCVEAEIKHTCAASPYTPRTLHGIRFRNTYHTGEITNHAYGIAIDIDPERNPCCGCLGPASISPRCARPSPDPYTITSLPRCWVNAFTKFGFYWLGEDPMQDTMHFEFLGDPDRIVRH